MKNIILTILGLLLISGFVYASETRVASYQVANEVTLSYAFASSTPIISGTTHFFTSLPYAVTCSAHTAKAEDGTSLVIQLSDGTNHATSITASTTAGTMAISDNNSFTKYEPIQIRFGTNTGSSTKGFYSAYCTRTLE